MQTATKEQVHKQIFDELEVRRVRRRKLTALEYRPGPAGKDEWPLALPGTVTLILARANAPVLAEIEDAVRSPATGADVGIAKRLLEGIARKSGPGWAWTSKAASMLAEPVWADVRYGGKTLANALWVPPDLEAAVVVFPYTGGRLAPDAFTLVEHLAAGSDAELDAILLVHSPELTAAERGILRRMPEDESEQVVGEALHGDCWECVADYAVYVVVAVVVLTFLLVCLDPPDSDTVINPADFKPGASVGELLALRRRMLSRAMKQLQEPAPDGMG